MLIDHDGHNAFRWSKACASAGTGMCVEVAAHPGGVAVRHSLTPQDGAILYTRGEFAAFLDGAKKGEFDHLV